MSAQILACCLLANPDMRGKLEGRDPSEKKKVISQSRYYCVLTNDVKLKVPYYTHF